MIKGSVYQIDYIWCETDLILLAFKIKAFDTFADISCFYICHIEGVLTLSPINGFNSLN
jgi:hypothetical protein